MKRLVKASIGKRDNSVGEEQPASAIRLPAALINRIDVWAGEHDAPTRADAIRRLVELGLTVKAPRSVSGGQRARAELLAGRQIDRMGDTAATTEERASRKQRLTQGPSVFREVRHDRPKKKTLE